MSHHDNDHGHAAHDDYNVQVHIAPVKFYIGIFMALVAFTIATVALSYVHLGAWNLNVAIIIATIKASLVVTFFMHLKDDSRFNALVFVGSLVFIGVFFVYTMNDTNHRHTVDANQGGYFYAPSGERAPGGKADLPVEQQRKSEQ